MSQDYYHLLNLQTMEMRFLTGEIGELPEKIRELPADKLDNFIIIDSGNSHDCDAFSPKRFMESWQEDRANELVRYVTEALDDAVDDVEKIRRITEYVTDPFYR